MSFGYAVGDVIATLQLFERVALEVRNYRNAPQHFQQLGAELQLLQGTLRRLLQLEPTCEDEKQQLEHIRAIAIHCHQPVQAFINKMRGSRRLHWSLITKNDVDDLRKVIMSETIAINMLLGLQQLSSLKRIRSGGDFIMSSEVKQFCTQSQYFFATSSRIFKGLENLPADIAGIQAKAAEQAFRQDNTSTQVINHLHAVSSQSKALVCQGASTVACLGRLENQISRSTSALISIARGIKEILCRLRTFSKDFSGMITANGRKILDMHAMMKSLVRAVEAIPLHLTLPIVRLDDALGESWALPYQACQTLRDFEEVLRSVVFTGGRPGARHVERGRFVIRTIKDGAPLNSQTWTSAVKEGAHLTQAMVLLATKIDLRECFVSDCSGNLQNDSNCCDICGRSSSSEIRMTSRFGIVSSHEVNSALPARMQRKHSLDAFAPVLHNWKGSVRHGVKAGRHGVRAFRNVHLVEKIPPIASVEEAERTLQRDPFDPNASQYLGWDLLHSRKGSADAVENAITWLKRSISQDARQLESYYLLGRAFMDLNEYEQAYNAYKQAVYINGRWATIWLSMGLLYYQINQYRDCLHCLTCSIQSNPYEPLVWRNMGVLYDSCDHREATAIDAYTRAFNLGLVDSRCQDRLNALQDYVLYGTGLPRRTIQMDDLDLRTATCYAYGIDQYDSIEIPSFRLGNIPDGADSETASDDWQSTSDDESDREEY